MKRKDCTLSRVLQLLLYSGELLLAGSRGKRQDSVSAVLLVVQCCRLVGWFVLCWFVAFGLFFFGHKYELKLPCGHTELVAAL